MAYQRIESNVETLLNTAPCGFISFGDDGNILSVNTTLSEMLGANPEVIVGKQFTSILPPAGAAFYEAYFLPLLKSQGQAEEIYLSLRTTSGEEVSVLMNAVRRLRDGSFISDCVLMKVRRRSRSNEEILKARRAVEEASQQSAQQSKELELAKAQIEKTLDELRSSYWHLRKVAEVLPMCMECGKVRSTEAQWESVADYLRKNSLFISHGCCPNCEEELMRKLGLIG